MLIKIVDGSPVRCSEDDVRQGHPNVSFPKSAADWSSDMLADFDYSKEVIPEKPQESRGKRASLSAPTLEDGEWRSTWALIDLVPSPSQIKAEANRRILEIIPEWKQRNLIAQATQLLNKGRDNWTGAETAAWQAGDVIWAQVSAIRTASNEIEALDPIPSDFYDDKHWP